MTWIDWLIVAAYLLFVVGHSVWHSLSLHLKAMRAKGKSADAVEAYLLAGRSLPWWAVGLTIMATQMSAITLVGTTGQAYASGMRFIQFYFGLPIAMVILSLTVVPFFHRAKIYTAYEYLEQRFDARTRALTSLIFLTSRGLSCGVIIAAPAVILSIVLGWNEEATVITMGIITTAYTVLGGVRAVAWADVKQMVLIVTAVLLAMVVIVHQLPAEVSVVGALRLAALSGRLQAIDSRFDVNETYTLWSGLIGGLFLMLAYFGCDQSQVQRYLSARSVDEGRISLIFNGFAKIPLQAMILTLGILVFSVYHFVKPPLIFQPDAERKARIGAYGNQYAALEARYDRAFEARRTAALAFAADSADARDPSLRGHYVHANAEIDRLRKDAGEVVRKTLGESRFSDVNYVFPTFIVQRLPTGLVGLLIAAILAAAMSAIAGELTSLSTSTVVDIYKRHVHPDAPPIHYLRASRVITGFWGAMACAVALNAAKLGSLIEVVNRLGSFFYGSLLGVFTLAIAFPRARAVGAFYGLIAGIVAVAVVANTTRISFLWYNVVGCVAVVVTGLIISRLARRSAAR